MGRALLVSFASSVRDSSVVQSAPMQAFHGMPIWFLVPYFFLLGAIVGSFLNVVIYRVPAGKSIVTPRSFCPNCQQKIPWYYNIPILSYLILRGRCAYCKTRISFVYPFVEALTGAYFVLLLYYYGVHWEALIYAFFGCALIVLIFIDYYHRLLPRVITYPSIIIGIATSFINPYINPLQSVLGIVVGGLLPTIVLVLYKWIRKKEGMGHGDIVLLAMVGSFLGWKMVFLVILFSSLLGVVIGAIVIYGMKKGSDFPLPFGSFIGAVALATVFWGRFFWHWYLGL